MTFLELLYGAEVLSQSGNPGIGGLEYDSRRIKPGDAFVAMKGESSDGNKFIDQAIAAGAVAIVTDSATEKARPTVAWAQVPHGRRALARLSANFYKQPAERLAITGITGTNGKSTTAFLLESILNAAGRKSALIGTIEYHVAGKVSARPAHDARSARTQSHAEPGSGPGRNRGGDGSFLARAGAAAGLWNSVRCRRFHQPHPRPSRLSSHHG